MVSATVHPQPSAYADQRSGAVYIGASVADAANIVAGSFVRISTRRGRTVVGRVAGMLDRDQGPVVQFDRFARQSLKAFPHEQVDIERVDLAPAGQVVLTPAIEVPVGNMQQLIHQVTSVLAEQQAPVREGMLLYVKLPDGLAGITYDVHGVAGGEGYVDARTAVYLSFGNDHDHGDEEGGHHHEHQRAAERIVDTTYEDVGGLTEQIRAVRELVELPLLFPQVYRQLGIAPPRGVIFYGAPGTGKTLLARSVANEIDARFTYINGPEIVGTYSGQTEENLRKVFGEASLEPPSIIFIDEIDAIAPTRGSAGTLSDLRAVTQLMALMDGLKRAEGVVVIGTTNRIEAIDPAMRRAGRFDREVYFPTPSAAAREQILRVHTREMPLSPDALALLPEVARRAHGFVGADLMELSREAALAALRRAAGDFLDSPSLASYPKPADLMVTSDDLEDALRRVRPAALRESLLVDPGISWSDVGGLADIKRRLQDLIEQPLRTPEAFARLGLATNLGVLLYGPPGAGKTLLAKAIASRAGVNFIPVQGAELFSQWLGESEEGVRRLFRTAHRSAPCIIFFDQLDAIAPRRAIGDGDGTRAPARVLNQLLAELDGMEQRSNVLVIGATNNVDIVDPAALRPGRFGVHLYVGLPDATDRAEILRIHLRGAALEPGLDGDTLVEHLVARSDGLSGADLAFVCQSAKLRALDRAEQALALEDFDAALRESALQRIRVEELP
ncbi:MAG TPA: AAA family ATPase [Chloroflexota bacterium]